MYTRTFIHTYIHTHKCMHIHIHSYIHAHTQIYTNTFNHMYTHIFIHPFIHTLPYIRTQTHTGKCTYVHPCALSEASKLGPPLLKPLFNKIKPSLQQTKSSVAMVDVVSTPLPNPEAPVPQKTEPKTENLASKVQCV